MPSRPIRSMFGVGNREPGAKPMQSHRWSSVRMNSTFGRPSGPDAGRDRLTQPARKPAARSPARNFGCVIIRIIMTECVRDVLCKSDVFWYFSDMTLSAGELRRRRAFQAAFLGRMGGPQPLRELFDHLPEVSFSLKDAQSRVVCASRAVLDKFGMDG